MNLKVKLDPPWITNLKNLYRWVRKRLLGCYISYIVVPRGSYKIRCVGKVWTYFWLFKGKVTYANYYTPKPHYETLITFDGLDKWDMLNHVMVSR